MFKKYPLVILAYVCAVMCLAVVLYIAHDADVASSWIKTPGEVTEIVAVRQGANTSGTSMGYKGSAEYVSVVTSRVAYTYSVDGHAHEGLAYSSNIADLKKGKRISVIYNPDNTKQSRLESAVPWHLVIMWLMFSAVFYASGRWWYQYQNK